MARIKGVGELDWALLQSDQFSEQLCFEVRDDLIRDGGYAQEGDTFHQYALFLILDKTPVSDEEYMEEYERDVICPITALLTARPRWSDESISGFEDCTEMHPPRFFVPSITQLIDEFTLDLGVPVQCLACSDGGKLFIRLIIHCDKIYYPDRFLRATAKKFNRWIQENKAR